MCTLVRRNKLEKSHIILLLVCLVLTHHSKPLAFTPPELPLPHSSSHDFKAWASANLFPLGGKCTHTCKPYLMYWRGSCKKVRNNAKKIFFYWNWLYHPPSTHPTFTICQSSCWNHVMPSSAKITTITTLVQVLELLLSPDTEGRPPAMGKQSTLTQLSWPGYFHSNLTSYTGNFKWKSCLFPIALINQVKRTNEHVRTRNCTEEALIWEEIHSAHRKEHLNLSNLISVFVNLYFLYLQ